MSWQLSVRCAETILQSPRILPSEEIISIIKRVNPTRLQLSETEREQGYQIKNRLQNLLLENYGAAFHLAPHPYRPDIILIKHNVLPSVDACHADLNALSARALATVGEPATPRTEDPAKCQPKAKRRIAAGGDSPKDSLRTAELLIEQYEYPQAEEVLAAIRITETRDLPVLVKAARALVEEIGAYQKSIDLLLAQPRQLLKDKEIREIFARSYYGNGMIPEARAVFDAIHPADLGKDALYAYADISFKDGNLWHAFHLLKLSEEKEGFVTAHASLRKEIEAAMLEEARPYLQQAESAFASGDLAKAESLLQHALSLYPNFQKARQLAGEIDALKKGAELARLWARLFECSGTAEDRLGLLAQLLEQDKENTGTIKALLAREKCQQKQETVEERLRTLQALAEQESWEPCLNLVLWLSHQADEDSYRRACSISPLFSLLYHNKKLQRHSQEEAKELWLRFVNLKRHRPQRETECCWNVLQELKQYFYSYPLFREEYDRVEAQEQEKAKHEVEQLLDRLEELGEQEEPDLSEARRLGAQVRKRLGMLAADEASLYKELAENAVNRLEPVRDDGESILDYREYLLLANAAKAEKYRESHNYPGFQEMIKQIDDEIGMLFTISAEPITLTVSPEMAVELATEPASSELELCYSSHCHLLFKQSDNSLVVVDVRNMTATRYRSPQFQDLAVVDALPDRDVFLFADRKSNHTLWRATLSGTRSRFTSRFELTVPLPVQEGGSMTSLFMSSTKDNVYYLFIVESDQMQVVKQSIDLTSTVESTFAVKGTSARAFRLSYQPDRFVISTDDSTTVLESNLTRPKNSSRVGSTQPLNCLGINVQRSLIYAAGDGVVSLLNPNLRAVKQYLKAPSVAHIIVTTPANICVEKSTALFNNNGRGLFYNLETNKFSQKFLSRRVLHTDTPSRWYYMESDMTKPVIMIKDITDEVDTLLEWRVLLSTIEDEEAAATFVERFSDPDFFSIVKRVD